MTILLADSVLIALLIINGMLPLLSFFSSSFALSMKINLSLGQATRARFSTFLAFSYVSNLLKASHISTELGTHSTARESIIRALLASSRSMAVCHKMIEFGMISNALRSTAFLFSISCSRLAAFSQILTDFGIFLTAAARIFLASFGECKRAASIQISCDEGQASVPRRIIDRAATSLPAASSKRAAAIQPGGCLGLVVITDFSNWRALRMSETSVSEVMLIEVKSVR
mmetsp:Transcript_58406/g.92839  ORF Transcript_58406/g.92839 Transcript_58406/m.92839 type:complete len:229 (-) Transcript_58406:91-777(-)